MPNWGWRAAPSRGSCLTCRKRRVRCPRMLAKPSLLDKLLLLIRPCTGNKPACERCWNDNKECVYAEFLRWEEDSNLLGVAHGRSRQTSQSILGETWKTLVVKRGNFHFLNFGVGDMDTRKPFLSSAFPAERWPIPISSHYPEYVNDLYAYC
jgi:hypothetical protein